MDRFLDEKVTASSAKLLESYFKQSAVTEHPGFAAVQEAALFSLTRLSKQAINPILEQLEHERNSAKEIAQATYNVTVQEEEKTCKAEVEKIEHACHEQVDGLKKEFNLQRQSLLVRTKNEKEKASDSIEMDLSRAKSNYEYELMVAEVVQKGAIAKQQARGSEVKEAVAGAKSQIAQVYNAGRRVFDSYRVEEAEVPQRAASIEAQNDPMQVFADQKALADYHLYVLNNLVLPKVFLTPWRFVIAAGLCAMYVVAAWMEGPRLKLPQIDIEIGLGVGLLIVVAIIVLCGRGLRALARSQLRRNFKVIRDAYETVTAVLDKYLKDSLEQAENEISQAKSRYQAETSTGTKKYERFKTESEEQGKQIIKNAASQFGHENNELESSFTGRIAVFEREKETRINAIKANCSDKLARLRSQFDSETGRIESEYDGSRQKLKTYWLQRLCDLKSMLDEGGTLDPSLSCSWCDPAWSQWMPKKTGQQLVRFGTVDVDMGIVAPQVQEIMGPEVRALDKLTVPAVLTFPDRCSMLIQSPHKAKHEAVDLVKAAMIRLFTSVPAGLIHFTIFDPVGLGKNFVGFMHAADYEKSLVGGRIWTDSEHIRQCLAELTTHMENVIQKYLRNEYESIEAYNLQAGELAEPYRFLIIADFPTNFNDDAIRRLKSIITSGPRCGVYTILLCDAAHKLPEGIVAQDIAANGVHLVYQNGRFVWQHETFKQFPFTPDSPPPEEILTDLVKKIGEASIDATRVEVPFESITPGQDELWSLDTVNDVRVPIGRSGAKRLQYMQLGKGVNQHMLIAGKTGSGKSTLFHILVTNMALWYSPGEVEFYLIDFKQGVEFKVYTSHKLPHARAVAIESDREFGLSILQKLDDEMNARGEEFRKAGVQDITAFRRHGGRQMPRTILIIDEFHILFADDDKIAHDSTMLLEKLVRQGRAFGIHVILGSQSLAGTAGISRSIMGQMAVRIALQCSEMDSQIILNEDNVVARLLARPGEAIYNDAGGMVVGNNPFQVAWLPKATQDEYLARIGSLAESKDIEPQRMIVFEGNVPADIASNDAIAAALKPGKSPDGAPRIWLGEPVVIKEPTAVMLNRHNGTNLLIVGQQDSAMAGVLCSTLLSLLLQCPADSESIIVLDGGDPVISSRLKRIDAIISRHNCRFVQAGSIAEAISAISGDIASRLENTGATHTEKFLFVPMLQRFRVLYRKEDDWSLRSEEKAPGVEKLFADIIREGPAAGVHTIIGIDTFKTLERFIDRQTLREFNNRVLFQMSAADSSSLIDSPLANQLGFQRALFYNDEQGTFEKFRFYAAPDENWLKSVR